MHGGMPATSLTALDRARNRFTDLLFCRPPPPPPRPRPRPCSGLRPVSGYISVLPARSLGVSGLRPVVQPDTAIRVHQSSSPSLQTYTSDCCSFAAPPGPHSCTAYGYRHRWKCFAEGAVGRDRHSMDTNSHTGGGVEGVSSASGILERTDPDSVSPVTEPTWHLPARRYANRSTRPPFAARRCTLKLLLQWSCSPSQ